MIVRALQDYRDKETKVRYAADSFREVNEQRGNELVEKGLAVEYILKPIEPEQTDENQEPAIETGESEPKARNKNKTEKQS